MPCFSPLQGWRSKSVNESGKRSLVFKEQHGLESLGPVNIPCGQCIGCRLERSRQWAMRCLHEASLYENNCFITLTYNDKNLPSDWSLQKRDYQLFMKNLRKRFVPKNPFNKNEYPSLHDQFKKMFWVRYFHCGEYGEECGNCGKNKDDCRLLGCNNWTPIIGRPHYHACLFNIDFADKVLYKTQNGVKLYTSPTLQELWPHGFSTIGDVNFESAAYVARYIMKKINGEKAEEHYLGRQPEYTTMSRRPGIGQGWFDLFKEEVYPTNFIVMNGKKMTPPKYYDKQLEDYDKSLLLQMKKLREKLAKKHEPDNTLRRLRDREEVKLSQTRKLFRTLEQEN